MMMDSPFPFPNRLAALDPTVRCALVPPLNVPRVAVVLKRKGAVIEEIETK